jgi:tryptophan-rich sensory protein
MAGFNLKQYLIRVIKYAIYLGIVFLLIVAIFSLTSSNGFDYKNLFRPGTELQLIVFFVVISLIYPFFGFAKKRVYLNNGFENDREKILDIFTNSKYTVASETREFIVFKHKSPFLRLMRMFEDKITLHISDNPIILEGLRKDIYKLARTIEWHVRDDRKED